MKGEGIYELHRRAEAAAERSKPQPVRDDERTCTKSSTAPAACGFRLSMQRQASASLPIGRMATDPVVCGCRLWELGSACTPDGVAQLSDRHEVIHADALHDEQLAWAVRRALARLRGSRFGRAGGAPPRAGADRRAGVPPSRPPPAPQDKRSCPCRRAIDSSDCPIIFGRSRPYVRSPG